MKNLISARFVRSLAALATATALVGLTACENMSARERNTAVGAGVGAAAGAVLTGGSPAGTVGGAAVGGIIGNQIKK